MTPDLYSKTGLSLRRGAELLGTSSSTLWHALRGNFPKRNKEELRAKLAALCAGHGLSAPASAPVSAQKSTETPQSAAQDTEEKVMLLRKQSASAQARKHFGLTCDPFGELTDRSQVWLSKDIRYVRESLLHVACHGGLLAVVGESGSGKSTLRKDLHERLAEEARDVVLIYPQMLGSEANALNGSVLKAGHIVEAVISTVSPGSKIPRSPEMRGRFLISVLQASAKAGFRHCLVIEEAHTLNLHTIKHLKRFYEIESGFKRLLSIIMIGQTELYDKLSEQDADTREVVQRCEVVTLDPIADVEGYVRHRLALAGGDAGQIFTADAFSAVRLRLAPHGVVCTYPLAIGNVVNRALNLAAQTGETIISRDVVMAI